MPSDFRILADFRPEIFKINLQWLKLFLKKNAALNGLKWRKNHGKCGKLPFFRFLTWMGFARFPLCLTRFHFVLHIFKKFIIWAFSQYMVLWGFFQLKKSYGTLKFCLGSVSHLCPAFSYICNFKSKVSNRGKLEFQSGITFFW